jgi:hypothetical protein
MQPYAKGPSTMQSRFKKEMGMQKKFLLCKNTDLRVRNLFLGIFPGVYEDRLRIHGFNEDKRLRTPVL